MKSVTLRLLTLHLGLAAVVAQPVITNQPQNLTNIAGTTAIFTVGATGTPPLFYQWGRNAAPLQDETNATLVLTNVQPPSPQNYSVVVSNAEGSVISANGRLFILGPPSITRQPFSQSAAVGDAIAFTVSATGTAPLSYQWLFNGQALTGQTLAMLTRTSVQLSNVGAYRVVVTNAFGSVTSEVAILTVGPIPHGFGKVTTLSGNGIRLTLAGVAPAVFKPYYDLYPLDVSTNLRDWSPLVTLVRTNASNDLLTYVDAEATNHSERFYRTPTNQLTTAIPSPDGPYRVGVISRLLTDLSRTNRYVTKNSSFMVSIWYPAQPSAGVWPGLYLDPQIAALGPAFCFTGHYPGAHGHALPGVSVATNESKYPLVIYSHGHQETRTDNTRKIENLVSYGFIVLALDHINCRASVFPDGKLFRGMDAPGLGPGDPTTMWIATNRAEDIRFVLDEATRWNAGDPMLTGRLDLNQVGIFGHSFGGGTSTAACAQDARVKAGLSLDGGYHFFPIPALDRPFLILSGGDNDAFMQQFRNAFRNLFDRLTHDAYWVHLQNSTHCDFNDTPWFDSPTSTALIRRALVQDRYVVSFFRKYLRNEDDHFLDGRSNDWPEVDQFLKK